MICHATIKSSLHFRIDHHYIFAMILLYIRIDLLVALHILAN